MVTRRGLLAAGGALALTGCGADASDDEAAKPGTSETGRRADIEVLDGLLGMERLCVAAAGVSLDRGEPGAAAILAHERAHVAALETTIRAARGRPSAEKSTYDLGGLAEIKQTAIAAYLDALPKLSDERHRRLAASILAVEGSHLAALIPQLGAFVSGGKGRYLP